MKITCAFQYELYVDETRRAALSRNAGCRRFVFNKALGIQNERKSKGEKLLTYKEQVFSPPNVLVLGGQVWPKLRTNPAVKGYIQSRASTAAGPVPLNVELSLVAELLGLERVVVGRAKYNSAQEGATAVSSYIWGKSAALIRVEPNPDPLMTETFGYTYRFGGKAYRNEVIPDRLGGAMGGQYIKLSTFEDDVVIGGANTGYLLTTVIS